MCSRWFIRACLLTCLTLLISRIARAEEKAIVEGTRPPEQALVKKHSPGRPRQNETAGSPFAFWQPYIDGNSIRIFSALFGQKPEWPDIARPPFPPLEPAHLQVRDRTLDQWEMGSKRVDRLSVKFQRWEYDPVFGPRDTYRTFATGVAKFEKPNKWMYRVERELHYSPPSAEGEKAKYVSHSDEPGEDWRCDGKSLVQLNYASKQLNEIELPPEDSERVLPFAFLPFFVGVKAGELNQRFWIQIITPQDAEGEDWLELFPKRSVETFQKMEVILDQKDRLPKAIQVYQIGYDFMANPARFVLLFEKHLNPDQIRSPCFPGCSFSPTLPKGWQRTVSRASPLEASDRKSLKMDE